CILTYQFLLINLLKMIIELFSWTMSVFSVVLFWSSFCTLQDLSRILLLKMMSDQMTTTTRRNKVLPDLEEELGIREEVVRQLPLTHRERKAGCRNFFWKTFTSC
uniref:Somatostatin/Cortistatin C-terminal domain-containing protein n=1 Tax=Esox lucius TaxID=8010 RepID=A0AAY5KJK0_ESOLU